MKLQYSWIFNNILIICIILFFGFLSIHISLSAWFDVPILGFDFLFKSNIVLVVLVNLSFCIFIFLLYNHQKQGIAYEKKVDISLDKFEIKEYENIIVIAIKKRNFAYTFERNRYPKLNVKELTSVPMINFYNKDAKFLLYRFNL